MVANTVLFDPVTNHWVLSKVGGGSLVCRDCGKGCFVPFYFCGNTNKCVCVGCHRKSLLPEQFFCSLNGEHTHYFVRRVKN